ncbi:MAG: DUF1826 domain-containing protein [Bacteroidota bacterium]
MKISNYLPFLKVTKNDPRQVISHNWEDRKCILKPEINLFDWERLLDKSIVQYLETQIEILHKPIRYPIDRKNLCDQIKDVRAMWKNNSNLEGGELFWQDVYKITKDFLEFSENGMGILHLKVVSNDACAKFHIDGYDLRLFTSYLGPGTEWLPENAVNRVALGTSNDRIVKDQSKVQRMKTGDVGILKGELPNRKSSVKGIVHRSPEISQTGEKRIILRVDV